MTKRLRQLGGTIVALASSLFLIWAVYRSLSGMPSGLWHPGFIALLAGLGIGYLGINQVLGLAWFVLIRELEPARISWSAALAIFNRTQFYKYLPGNVFHMLGRFAMANEAGVPARSLALAQVGEIATQLVVAALIAILFGGRMLLPVLEDYSVVLARLIVPGAVLAAIGLIVAVLWLRTHRQLAVRMLRACSVALPVYAAFLVLSGGCALVIMHWLDPAPVIGNAELIGLFAASWLIGFVVPGAPGGLGAREALVVVGMTLLGAGLPLATATALTHRIVTIMGDALAAGVGWLMLRKQVAPSVMSGATVAQALGEQERR
ncbi:lysylphosphatidylglycerol synthase domain-containing protein [Novosphingobium piscinae]|uniref:Flippase-like domain-containing protein n=1 Tax=Novosphingobium piscinae TaxID=1507448 RepID=A0A7X1KP91_9SPHN|nr:lysylphosphatidylglycerol synthase domain-containing protein [Novosphingobium piscinae]MBC2668130.1 flippase-like domain-containing protein [Novosphingobium piscinae]